MELFTHLLGEKNTEVEDQMRQIEMCLESVEEGKERVRNLREKLQRERIVVEEKGKVWSQCISKYDPPPQKNNNNNNNKQTNKLSVVYVHCT